MTSALAPAHCWPGCGPAAPPRACRTHRLARPPHWLAMQLLLAASLLPDAATDLHTVFRHALARERRPWTCTAGPWRAPARRSWRGCHGAATARGDRRPPAIAAPGAAGHVVLAVPAAGTDAGRGPRRQGARRHDGDGAAADVGTGRHRGRAGRHRLGLPRGPLRPEEPDIVIPQGFGFAVGLPDGRALLIGSRDMGPNPRPRLLFLLLGGAR